MEDVPYAATAAVVVVLGFGFVLIDNALRRFCRGLTGRWSAPLKWIFPGDER